MAKGKKEDDREKSGDDTHATNKSKEEDEKRLELTEKLATGPCCKCSTIPMGPIGDQKLDEMIEFAIQNLLESTKALQNLGENFEHDLKLMFVDIVARVQHWVAVVQNRLDAARADLEALREELKARACLAAALMREMEELKKKLQQEMDARKACEAAMAAANAKIGTSTATGTGNGHASKNVEENGDRRKSKRDSVSQVTCTGPSKGDKEKEKRIACLEAQVACYKKQQEHFMREKQEYENGIQRALLRGMSSLNAEALCAMKCPAMSCCSPCVSFPPEDTCGNGNGNGNGNGFTRSTPMRCPPPPPCCPPPPPCCPPPPPFCPPCPCPTPKNGSMVFLLQQVKQPPARTICVGGRGQTNVSAGKARMCCAPPICGLVQTPSPPSLCRKSSSSVANGGCCGRPKSSMNGNGRNNKPTVCVSGTTNMRPISERTKRIDQCGNKRRPPTRN